MSAHLPLCSLSSLCGSMFAPVCVCVGEDKDKRQDGMRVCLSNANCTQKLNQFHLSGEIHHIIFCCS